MSRKKLISYLKLSGLISIPIVLWILPADFFDHGPPMCLSQILLHKSCPGCGLTRAVQHSMHLGFTDAWDFNKLIILIFPALIYFWAKEILKAFASLKEEQEPKN